jgi:hypothetical protein
MLDRIKQFRIRPNQTCQRPCIYLVVLASVLMDRFNFPRVGDENLMPLTLQQSTYPGRMCSNLDCHTALWYRRKQFVQLRRCRSQSSFCKDISFRIQEAVIAFLVSKIYPYVESVFLAARARLLRSRIGCFIRSDSCSNSVDAFLVITRVICVFTGCFFANCILVALILFFIGRSLLCQLHLECVDHG